jgi:hypothetical protein
MKLKPILNIVFLVGLLAIATVGFSCRAQPPSIAVLNVTPAEITAGESSTLNWSVEAASTVTIDQNIGSVPAIGSKQLTPLKTTAYTVTATSAGGIVTRSVVIYVTEPPVVEEPAVDTTPPVIKDVLTSSETDTSAVITWTTNEPATTDVAYGKEADYGLTASSTGLATDHTITLSGLEANTAYHFKVTSKDEAGNEASSEDDMFVTSQEISPYSVRVVSEEWGRRTETNDINMGGPVVTGKTYLYVEGQAQNKSQASLKATIITMNCWSGSTIVKYEVYVHRSPVLPGQVFSYNIETADDPTVDKVTTDFADYVGRTMEVVREPE